jgi:hypothetical protein
MTPLQKIAMGFVLVLLDPVFFGYDAVPDLLGWLMILAGTWDLRAKLGHRFPTLFGLGIVSLLLSAATFVPTVTESLPPSGGWFVSLPQLVFMGLLCLGIADLSSSAEPDATATPRRFRRIVWAIAVVAVIPVVVFAAELESVAPVAAAVAVGVLVFFIYALFKVSKRDYVLR